MNGAGICLPSIRQKSQLLDCRWAERAGELEPFSFANCDSSRSCSTPRSQQAAGAVLSGYTRLR
jgi:hypothetical protein